MKYKIIALAVSGALLAACGSDNDNYVEAPGGSSTSLQAFDGAVRYLDAYMNCAENGWDYIGETGGKGIINIGEGNFPLFDENPSSCIFEFGENIYPSGGGTQAAVDESNNKPMTNVRYLVPGQLVESGQPIVGTPYSTLVALKIFEAEENNQEVDLDAIINEAFDETLPAGTNLTEEQKKQFLANPEETLSSLDETTSKNLQASTMVLSDAIAAQVDNITAGTTTASQLETATQKTATVVAQDPDFPTKEVDGETVPTYVDTTDYFKDENFDTISDPDDTTAVPPPPVTEGEELEEIPPTDIPPVEEELPPPTGGTGGSAG
ncbi:hypothetical protein [Vibrio comitans]|uniref:Lipoprotein n=1 Tax=Vibrio comitans NBRC 102076 TaxID=1219078 RepID=A0A4Y3ILV7_9VIBR|nr:hypothetical protein [Vibrio comitans]GEA60105.1 hypothetical protein VCO01S_12980 [Vibrio comitans NBRC 102076]